MFNKLVHILLIAIVFACPVICDAGFCSCDSDLCIQTVETDCCCQSSEQQSPVPPTPNKPAKPSSCFCGGAIVVDTFELDSLDQFEFFVPTLTKSEVSCCGWTLSSLAASAESFRALLYEAAPSGQMIRCIILSFQI